MEKTHIEIEANIMGEKYVIYMQPYDNLPPQLPPCCPSHGGLSRRLPRPLACCPPRLSAQDKICPRRQHVKRKILAVWTVHTPEHIGTDKSFHLIYIFIKQVQEYAYLLNL